MANADTVSKEIKFLKEWTVRYIKNKDILTKRITSLKEDEDSFVFIKNEKEQKLLVFPFLDNIDRILNEIKKYKNNRVLVCFHTRKNYDILIQNWKKFVDIGRDFAVYFINPFSKTDRILILNPYTHNLIADEESLEQGLKTMSESVEFTTEDEIKKIISS